MSSEGFQDCVFPTQFQFIRPVWVLSSLKLLCKSLVRSLVTLAVTAHCCDFQPWHHLLTQQNICPLWLSTVQELLIPGFHWRWLTGKDSVCVPMCCSTVATSFPSLAWWCVHDKLCGGCPSITHRTAGTTGNFCIWGRLAHKRQPTKPAKQERGKTPPNLVIWNHTFPLLKGQSALLLLGVGKDHSAAVALQGSHSPPESLHAEDSTFPRLLRCAACMTDCLTLGTSHCCSSTLPGDLSCYSPRNFEGKQPRKRVCVLYKSCLMPECGHHHEKSVWILMVQPQTKVSVKSE